MSLSLVACGSETTVSQKAESTAISNESVQISSVSEEEVSDVSAVSDTEDISQDAIIGKYVEINSGISLRIEDEYLYPTSYLGNFWSAPLENTYIYDIEGTHLITRTDEEGWDSFDITPYGSGYSLSNDVYSFIPFDDYYSFEHAEIHKISDKVSVNGSSISLLNNEYTDNLDILEYVTESWVDSYKDDFILEAPEDKVFVKLHVKLENEGKEAYNVSDILSVALVYDNSYVFHSYDTEGNSIISEPMNYCYAEVNSAQNGGDLNISPLSSKELTINMLCPSAIAENEDKPLYVTFSLINEDGKASIAVYDLR